MLPNFIIAGAHKSGTTALRIYLAQHPDIYMVNKEVHFFDEDKNFGEGIEWYEKFFEKWNGEKATGEKTPAYLYNEQAPERIYTFLPNVKLLFVLRNSIDRAYSHYWHNLRRGIEPLSFEESLEKEEERLQHSEYKELYSYKDKGKYSLQIKRYAEYFPQSQMLFILAEELKEHREDTLRRVLEFLEVEADFEFKDLEEKHVGGLPRSKLLAKLTGSEKIKKYRSLSDFMLWINTKKGDVPAMKKETRRKLQKYFEAYNNELKKFTGLDLSKWENGNK